MKELEINHQKNIIFIIVAALTIMICWGCYPKQVGPVGPDGARLTWIEMNFDQRKEHMRKEVLPRAAVIFQTWRSERFSQIDCSLCHGKGPNAEAFQMPTTHLPRLSGELLLGPEFKKYPDTTRLKLNRLVPEIADSLGLKTFSIITRSGFGCYSCHLGPTGSVFGN